MGVPLDNEGLINYSVGVTLVGTFSKLPAYHQMCLQYRSSFQSSTLIGRAVTRSQTSLGVRAGYDVFRMYAVLISTNQIRALKITPG